MYAHMRVNCACTFCVCTFCACALPVCAHYHHHHHIIIILLLLLFARHERRTRSRTNTRTNTNAAYSTYIHAHRALVVRTRLPGVRAAALRLVILIEFARVCVRFACLRVCVVGCLWVNRSLRSICDECGASCYAPGARARRMGRRISATDTHTHKKSATGLAACDKRASPRNAVIFAVSPALAAVL